MAADEYYCIEEGPYRYYLEGPGLRSGVGLVLFSMLNPSKARANVSDPTWARCQKFARLWGYARAGVINPFAYSCSKPEELAQAPSQVGPRNIEVITTVLKRASLLVMAGGNPPALYAEQIGVLNRLITSMAAMCKLPVRALGYTQGGNPKHPLARGKWRVSDDQQPIAYPSGAA